MLLLLPSGEERETTCFTLCRYGRGQPVVTALFVAGCSARQTAARLKPGFDESQS